MPRKPEYDRDALIDLARDLFWQKGWAGTSMKDLEATLHLKPGSFYAAFGSKDNLFALALDRYSADGQARFRKLIDDLGPLEALATYPRLIIENTQAPARACMLSKSLLELQPRGHALADVANDHLLRMEDAFAAAFANAQKAGQIEPAHDPRTLARRYQSDLLGLRVSAERPNVDAAAIAEEIGQTIRAL